MPTLIPTSSDPFYTQTTTLDGTDYILEFRFNSREECWYLKLSLTDATTLIEGVKVVSNWPLLQKLVDARGPFGELVALAYGPDDSPAGLTELGIGQRVELTYFTKAEVPAGAETWRTQLLPARGA